MKISNLLTRSSTLLAVAFGWAISARADTPPVAAAANGYRETVEIKVNEKGEIAGLTLVASEDPSPGEFLGRVALTLAAKAKMPVEKKDGQPVAYTARIPYFFPIEGDEGPAAQKGPKPRGKTGESVQPNYPPKLAEQGEVGGAILEFVVGTDGAISRLKTLRASHPEFEQAATAAVKTWKFHPAEKDGVPIETRWRIAIVFDTDTRRADLMWRIAPRPSLGSFVVVHENRPVAAPASAAPGAPAPAAPNGVPAAPPTPPPAK